MRILRAASSGSPRRIWRPARIVCSPKPRAPMQQQNAGTRRVAAFALMALIWGLTWLPMKLASEVVPPIFLAAVRFVLATMGYLVIAKAMNLPLLLVRPGRIVLASLLINT